MHKLKIMPLSLIGTLLFLIALSMGLYIYINPLEQESMPSFIQASSNTALATGADRGSKQIKIMVRGDNSYPPFEYLNKTGQPEGFNIDILQKIGQMMNLNLQISLGPWDEVRSQLENGKIDMLLGMYKTPERDSLVDFAMPHFIASYAVFVPRNSPIIQPDGIKKRRIAVQLADIGHDYLVANQLGSTLVLKKDWQELLPAVLTGEADCAVLGMGQGLLEMKEKDYDLQMIPQPLFQRRYCIAVKENNNDLLASVNEGLNMLKSSGEYDKIYEKWFGKIETAGMLESKNARLLLIIVTLLLLAGSAGSFWLAALKHQVWQKTQELSLELQIRKESEERFKYLIKASPAVIYTYDIVENQPIPGFSSDNITTTLGYSVEQLASLNFRVQCLHPSDRDSVFKSFSMIQQTGSMSVEYRFLKADGKYIWLQDNAILINNAGLKIIGSFLDVTSRKEAEESLAAEKELLSVTLRSIGEGVITTDIQGRITLLNRVAENLTGKSQLEVIGQQLTQAFKLFDTSSGREIENPLIGVLSTGHVLETGESTQLLDASGKKITINYSAAPIRDNSSSIIGMVIAFQDITEKQKLLENMQRTDKLDSLGVFAGGIAHDFNNQLSGIFGYIEMAKRNRDNPLLVADYLDKSLIVLERSKNLTLQLLTFAKGGVPKRESGDLGKVIRESSTFALSGSNVAVQLSIQDDLWRCDFDANQIGQVLDNIIINAKQAMSGGGRVDISAVNTVINENGESQSSSTGRFIHITISDNGPGIRPELLNKIFDPFFTTKSSGTGLGLTTSFSIIRQHDGRLFAESQLNLGTTFHIYLPASEQHKENKSVIESTIHRGAGEILIMDDESFIREIVTDMLQEMGYQAVTTRDGTEALAVLAEYKKLNKKFAAAIFDLTIPGGMGGREAITKVREISPDLPVFASSGYSEDPVIGRPTEYGFTDSIRKPYMLEELAKILSRYLPAENA